MNLKDIENAERLSGALSRHTDSESIRALAKILHYNEAQLHADIEALHLVINQIEYKKGS